MVLPFQTKILRFLQTKKKFADNNFKFDENSRNNTKMEENNVGKGDIAKDLYCRH